MSSNEENGLGEQFMDEFGHVRYDRIQNLWEF